MFLILKHTVYANDRSANVHLNHSVPGLFKSILHPSLEPGTQTKKGKRMGKKGKGDVSKAPIEQHTRNELQSQGGISSAQSAQEALHQGGGVKGPN